MTIPSPEKSDGWDDDLVLLSAVNDYLYCPRRAWLHRVEGVFTHTAETLEGSHAHQGTDAAGWHHRDGVRIVHGLPLFATRLGLVGKADTVEFHPPLKTDQSDQPYPVEYKRGRRRKWDNDDAQLCAQALCLEEMFGVPVPAGAIFHVVSKRRREVVFDDELRNITLEAIVGIRRILSGGRIPPPVRRPRCRGCSLHSLCMPEVPADGGKVPRYVGALYNCKPDEKEQL
ncbi:MAG: CRISPR-associated protein Cas4 [Planctomycetota bacterium]|nr:CRISPR-associated protein Cas4 [Planctomycetota bacterium]